jgi:hypothetical protein
LTEANDAIRVVLADDAALLREALSLGGRGPMATVVRSTGDPADLRQTSWPILTAAAKTALRVVGDGAGLCDSSAVMSPFGASRAL